MDSYEKKYKNNAVFENTTTDLSLGEMVWFGTQGLKMKLDGISTHMLPGGSKSVYEPGIKLEQSYWIPKESEVLELVNEYFNPYNSKKDRFDLTDRTVTVHRFLASWQDEESVAAASKSANLNGRIFALLVKLFGLKNARRIRKFLKHPFRKERKE